MKKARIASLDYGLKRIGVAISDENQVIAIPLGIIETAGTPQETIQHILALLAPYSIEKLLIGNPIHLSGKISPLAESVKQFSLLLQAQLPYPIQLFDERLTSAQAERSLKDRGMNRKQRAKAIDALSATIILQCYLGY